MVTRATVPRRPPHWLPLALGLAWLSGPALLAPRRTGRPSCLLGRRALPQQQVGGLRTLLKQREECEKSGEVPPEECLAGLVGAYAVDGDLAGADSALEAFTAAGHSPTPELLEALLDASSKRGDLAAAQRHFGALNASGHPLTLDRHYLPLLAVLAKHGEAVEAKALVEGEMAPLKPDATAWAWAMLAYHRQQQPQERKEKRSRGSSKKAKQAVSKQALRVEYLFRKMLENNVTSNHFSLAVLKRAAGSKRFASVARELGLPSGTDSEGFRKKRKKKKDLVDPPFFVLEEAQPSRRNTYERKSRLKKWRSKMGTRTPAYAHPVDEPSPFELGSEELRTDQFFDKDEWVPPKKH